MTGLRMALLTEPWRALDEQRRLDRPVCLVAERATLDDRRMLPQKRAALVRMAAVAGVVDREVPQFELTGAAVWSMAIRAAHFPLPNRVRVGKLARMPLGGMAGEADFRLRRACEHRIGACVAAMTSGAGYVGTRVRTAAPIAMNGRPMTTAAHRVLSRDWRLAGDAKANYGGTTLSLGEATCVYPARTMASLALQLLGTKWSGALITTTV